MNGLNASTQCREKVHFEMHQIGDLNSTVQQSTKYRYTKSFLVSKEYVLLF